MGRGEGVKPFDGDVGPIMGGGRPYHGVGRPYQKEMEGLITAEVQ